MVHLDSCQREAEQLVGLEEGNRPVMGGLDQPSRAILENYMEQILSKAFAEQQEAYLQGLPDAFQILCGLGVLSTNGREDNSTLKNGLPE